MSIDPERLDRVECRDVLDGLASLPDECVQCVVTSPPYWGLRDYGVDGQYGLESTPEAHVARMVAVFREVRRVLRLDGTLWLNYGDSYAASGCGDQGKHGERADRTLRTPKKRRVTRAHLDGAGRNQDHALRADEAGRMTSDLKPKDLVGMPWRIAFALQADGWWLRQDIIWHKPNPMPESVRDRFCKAHEYVFLMAKSERYFFDAEAVKEAVSGTARGRGDGVNSKARPPAAWDAGLGDHRAMKGRYPRPKQNASFSGAVSGLVDKRMPRSVWTIQSQPRPEAHFATFPDALVEPCIKAGTPEGAIVLDPFAGSATTGVVAIRLGRRFLGFELNREYAEDIAGPRLEAARRGLSVRDVKAGQGSLFDLDL